MTRGKAARPTTRSTAATATTASRARAAMTCCPAAMERILSRAGTVMIRLGAETARMMFWAEPAGIAAKAAGATTILIRWMIGASGAMKDAGIEGEIEDKRGFWRVSA